MLVRVALIAIMVGSMTRLGPCVLDTLNREGQRGGEGT